MSMSKDGKPIPPPNPKGRPKGTRGRPKKQDVKDMLIAKDVIKYGIEEAYRRNNTKNSNDKSVVNNSWRILSKEVKAYIREYLQADILAETNKENLEKFYQLLIALFLKGDSRVKASDVRACLDSLSKLCPEFKDRHEFDEIQRKSNEELDSEIDDLVKKFQGKRNTINDSETTSNN